MPIQPIGAVPDVQPNTKVESDWGNAVGSATRGRVIQRFQTVAARDAAIPAPVTGMMCYVVATDAFYLYRQAGGWGSIQARDTLHSRVYRNASFNFTTAVATLVFDSIVEDGAGMYNPANGLFTCPVAGTYLLQGKTAANFGIVGQNVTIMVAHNTTQFFAGGCYAPAVIGLHVPWVVGSMKCQAGDTLQVQVTASATVAGIQGLAQTFASLDYLGTG
jgi:C1q domain